MFPIVLAVTISASFLGVLLKKSESVQEELRKYKNWISGLNYLMISLCIPFFAASMDLLNIGLFVPAFIFCFALMKYLKKEFITGSSFGLAFNISTSTGFFVSVMLLMQKIFDAEKTFKETINKELTFTIFALGFYVIPSLLSISLPGIVLGFLASLITFVVGSNIHRVRLGLK